MGVVMKAAMAKLQGKSADGKMVSEAVESEALLTGVASIPACRSSQLKIFRTFSMNPSS
jgi:hypothetical protein